MRNRQTPSLPYVWLVSDARIDSAMEAVLDRLPRGSGLIFRHYHLPPNERLARFRTLRERSRRRGHLVVLSGPTVEARRWGAAGAYGRPALLATGPRALRLVTVHSLRELAMARRADAVVLSPAFATESHPGARALGRLRFRLIAARAQVPVIARGGMDARRARAIGAQRWAAITSLAQPRSRMFSLRS